MPPLCPGLNVEDFQYAETPHVLHVFFFRALKTFHDSRPTSAVGEEAGGGSVLRVAFRATQAPAAGLAAADALTRSRSAPAFALDLALDLVLDHETRVRGTRVSVD